MKNLINLKTTREFIHDDDMTIKDKLQCLIMEASHIDAVRNDETIPSIEYESIRLMFKQIFIELFNQQDEWVEISTVEGHFIHNPDAGGIFNITEVFCNLSCGISLQMWLIGIGTRIFNVKPEIYDENCEYHNLTSGKIKLNEFYNIYEEKLNNQEINLLDVLCEEDIPNLENTWKLDNIIITELDYFVFKLEMELLFNPHNIQKVRLEGTNNDVIDILIFDESINVVEVYRRLRTLHSPDKASYICFDILHGILYNGVIKACNNPLKELKHLSLGV